MRIDEACVQLTLDNRSASGVFTSSALIDAALGLNSTGPEYPLILTAAHFLGSDDASEIRVHGKNWVTRPLAAKRIPGSDVAVLLLAGPRPDAEAPRLASTKAKLGAATVTAGYGNSGGSSRALRYSPGRIIAALPWAMSWNWKIQSKQVGVTAALTYPGPIRGDSGGPVLVKGEVVGLQSMLLAPFGLASGLAYFCHLPPLLPQLKEAVAELVAEHAKY